MQLNISHVSYTYPGAVRPAIADVSAVFAQGWTGVIGNNGCGKTTLARVAAGILDPDAGSVAPRLTSAYCEQGTDRPPRCLDEFGYDFGKAARRLRAQLGIEEDWPWRFATLSSGQKKALQVACCLWLSPEVLVVDEPTNHLDAPTREAVTRALQGFEGIGILISHDRELLDRLASRCLFFEDGRATMRPGGYSRASEQAALEHATRVASRASAKRELSRLQAEAVRRRGEADKNASRHSAANLDKHDHDARHRIGLAIYTGKDGAAGRLSARMDARLEAQRERVDSIKVGKRYDGDVWLDANKSPRKVVARLSAQSIPIGDTRTLELPDLLVGPSDRLALVGANGIGKSTLVRRLVAQIPDAVPHVYIAQEIDDRTAAAVTDRLRALDPTARGRVLSIVAQLNSDPDAILDGARTSPGELRKLMLALGILDRPALIVMDEPTNHLDLGSVEALERMLSGYPGAIVLVSHDARLVESIANQIWYLTESENGRVRVSAT